MSHDSLRLLPGGKLCRTRLAGLQVVVTGRDRPPFSVDAQAVEDDTFLVLGADPAYRECKEHLVRVMTAVHEAEPKTLGSIVVGSGHPLPLRVVVHDLSAEPTWTEASVTSGLHHLLGEVERRRLRSLGMPVLGGVHGAMRVERFLGLLGEAVRTVQPVHLQRIWLVAEPVDS